MEDSNDGPLVRLLCAFNDLVHVPGIEFMASFGFWAVQLLTTAMGGGFGMTRSTCLEPRCGRMLLRRTLTMARTRKWMPK